MEKHPDPLWGFNNWSTWNAIRPRTGVKYVSVAERHAGRVLKSEEARGETNEKGKHRPLEGGAITSSDF